MSTPSPELPAGRRVGQCITYRPFGVTQKIASLFEAPRFQRSLTMRFAHLRSLLPHWETPVSQPLSNSGYRPLGVTQNPSLYFPPSIRRVCASSAGKAPNNMSVTGINAHCRR